MSLIPSLRTSSGLPHFNDALRTLTGNDYETYTDLCVGMSVLSPPLLNEPGKAALNFIQLFGLKVIPDQASVAEIDRIANLNRYLSALYAFSEESEWAVSDRSFVSRECDGSTYRLRVEDSRGGMPIFILDKSKDGILTPERVTKLGSLTRNQFAPDTQDMNLDSHFTEVGRGCDIADLMTDSLLAGMKPDLEESVEKDVQGAGFDVTAAMIGSVNKTKVKTREPGL